jgi:hypothetical protein
MEPVYKRIERQRSLIIVFFGVLVVTLLILYFGYFKKEKALRIPPPEVPTFQRKIEIDFSVFEKEILKELQPFGKIETPSTEEIGRENPFSPIK